MDKALRIGTRESTLAVWQARQVENLLKENKQETELVYIKSEGDINLATPLYETGVLGIFTKALDTALLNNDIDLAVHSYKDVPTALAKGLTVAAVLERGNPYDVLVCTSESKLNEIIDSQTSFTTHHSSSAIHHSLFTIATSSIRRKAQWLYRYKNSQIENIRGNVNTRLQKLHSSNWHGAIFAGAGLERLNLTKKETGPQLQLNWMLPAPAQGAIVIICRQEDEKIISLCKLLNHTPTNICTQIERDFMRLLQGGCSTPISALATISEEEIQLTGNITASNGSESMTVELKAIVAGWQTLAKRAADEMIVKGGKMLLTK